MNQYKFDETVYPHYMILSSQEFWHSEPFQVGKRKISGTFVEYHKNGKKKLECTYKNCRFHGIVLEWDHWRNKSWIFDFSKIKKNEVYVESSISKISSHLNLKDTFDINENSFKWMKIAIVMSGSG